MDIIKWLRKNSDLIAAVGGILLILNLTGFNIDILAFYNGLKTEEKIAFVWAFNSIVSIMIVAFLLNKMNKIKR